ncbi:MAG: hypothetical protein ACO21V_08355 [Limnohabitans sp.]|jgi:hypothetical protein|nr:hypothetical protein [Burkholderiaceae bacterium]NBO02438.1 hypothetical protein [Betaproteobacteria bacterium]
MKRSLLLLALSGALAVAPSAFAHGGWRHGGGGHGGGGHGYHGGRGHWIGPVLGAALIGSAVYAATYPRVVYSQPMVVGPTLMPAPPVVVDPARVAYFCNTYQQYYPNVATCPVPWQVVPY